MLSSKLIGVAQARVLPQSIVSKSKDWELIILKQTKRSGPPSLFFSLLWEDNGNTAHAVCSSTTVVTDNVVRIQKLKPRLRGKNHVQCLAFLCPGNLNPQ